MSVNRFGELIEVIKKLKPKKVLDVGCGLGNLVEKLRAEGIETIGVDGSEVLEKDWWEGRKYFITAMANKLPFEDKTFDVVVSTDFFEHVSEEEIDDILAEMKRVVKPDGKIFAEIAYEGPLQVKQLWYHLTNKPYEWWFKRLSGVRIQKEIDATGGGKWV